jgi:rod shape determining protein RodA
MTSILTILGSVENFGKSKLVMQLAMTAVGTVIVFVMANLDYKFIVDRFYIYMFGASVLLLVLTLILGNTGVNMDTANKSWIKIPFIGISVQPSEFVKLAFLCTFSKHIDTVKDKMNKPLCLLGLLAHAGVIIGLILLSGDLGVALVYVGVMMIMLFCGGLSLWYFLAMGVTAVVSFPFLWDLLAPYQQKRIVYGFQPHLDPSGVGLQPLMSRETIARGGFFGIGLFGPGMYEDLAASHTDFIFATICEKFGFFGGFLILAALLILVIRVFIIAYRADCSMGGYIAAGLGACIMLQTVENIGMCLALLPVVGITLPFMSYGGSSVLAIYITAGLLHSIYAHRERPQSFYAASDQKQE